MRSVQLLVRMKHWEFFRQYLHKNFTSYQVTKAKLVFFLKQSFRRRTQRLIKFEGRFFSREPTKYFVYSPKLSKHMRYLYLVKHYLKMKSARKKEQHDLGASKSEVGNWGEFTHSRERWLSTICCHDFSHLLLWHSYRTNHPDLGYGDGVSCHSLEG